MVPPDALDAGRLGALITAVAAAPDEAAACRTAVDGLAELLGASTAAVRGEQVVARSAYGVSGSRSAADAEALRQALLAAARGGGGEIPPSSPELPAARALVTRPHGSAAALIVIDAPTVKRSVAPPGMDASPAAQVVRGLGPQARPVLDAVGAALGAALRASDAGALAAERAGTERDTSAVEDELRARLRERSLLLEALTAVQRAICRRAPLDEVLRVLTRVAGDVLPETVPMVLLRDGADPHALVPVETAGLPETLAAGTRAVHRVGHGVAGRAVSEERLVVVEDYGRWAQALPQFVSAGLQAAMAAPLRADGDVAGALMVTSMQSGRRFTSGERDLLSAFAEQAGPALAAALTVDADVQRALRDPLTGLPNRALLRDRLQHGLARARRTGRPLGVVLCDVDGFTAINRTVGRAAGDQVLVTVARRLVAALRASDTVSRLGDDSMAVLLEELHGPADGELVARRLLTALREPVEVAGQTVRLTASIGLAVGEGGAEQLLAHADAALERAKVAGGDRHVLYGPAVAQPTAPAPPAAQR